ncbi:protein SPATA31F1-like [Sorex fumeus]|uniref:protein SPATA31F1-like n=1 Tax=Sorex fumeus TaxID=62283 RepID=UPI0024AE79CC|nr:protein SPATA31F1-like [Sorex fumeus]
MGLDYSVENEEIVTDVAEAMLSPTFVLWDVGYPLYIYGSIFIIILIIWQLKRNYHRITLKSKRSYCQHYRKVKLRSRNAASRARSHFEEEFEKPKKLLSVIKSQGWHPQEGSVRQLLCANPCCDICNDVALEIQQLLADTKSQSSVTQLHAPSPSLASVHDYWAEHNQLNEEFQVKEVPKDPETSLYLRPENPNAPNIQQAVMQRSPNFICGYQGLNPPVPMLTMNQNITANTLAHPVAMHMVTVHPTHPSIYNPEILRLLEVHMKKWMHFQRWGLPRRVEESMRQFMPHPPLFYQPENNQPLSFIQHYPPNLAIERFGTLSYQTWGSCMAGQPTQAFWVSEWSIIDPAHQYHYQRIQNHLSLVLPSPAFKDLDSFYTLPGQQIDDSMSDLQQKYRQLFCGLPSLHSESLHSGWCSQELSLNESLSRLPMKDHFLFQKLSLLPLLPKTPPQSVQPSFQPSSNEIPSSERQETQNNVPFLTLAECEALEWHLLQKQFQLQWGLPAIFQGSQHVLSPMQHMPYDKSPSSGTVETSWPQEPTSVHTRGFLFFLEHSRRPLDFHLQRQLIHHPWSLYEKTQQPRKLVLSHNDQQPLSWRKTGVDTNVSVSKPTDLEATLAGEPFSHLMHTEVVHTPHLFAQAKAILQSHIHSKCGQILQGNVPACIYSSWGHSIPENLKVAPFTCIPESKNLELQAATDSGSQDEPIPRSPVTLDQQKQDPSDAVPAHSKVPQILSKAALEKLEVTLRHKYMAFLSGFPALYYVTLSRAMSPERITQAIMTEMLPKAVESPAESLTQKISSEKLCLSPEPCSRDTENTCADAADDFQAEAQMEEVAEPVTLESESEPLRSILLQNTKCGKLNFHLKKKILEVQLGIPIKAKESRKRNLEIITTLESLGTLNKKEKTLSDDIIVPADTPCDLNPDQLHHKTQSGIELKAVLQNQKQPLASEVPQDSNNWVAKISQPSGEITETQVLCVQLEATVSNPIVEEPSDHESHSSGKSMDSAQVSTLAEKKEDREIPKNVGNQGEEDAGPRDNLQLTLPKQTLGTHDRKHSEKSNLRGSQTKENVILKPARVAQYAQSTRPHMSQGQALLKQPLQRKPLQGQTLQNRVVQGQRMPVPTHKRPSLAESDLRSKMKSFLHSINPPKTMANRHEEHMLYSAEKVTRKENVQRNLAPAKSPMEQRGKPKAQCPPTPKQALCPSGVQVVEQNGPTPQTA